VSDHRALIAALRRPPSSRTAAIDALADVSLLRAALDEFERSAIDTARTGGASWAEIAAALGLASRQAAEQRRARLGGGSPAPGRPRQHNIDNLRRALHNLATLLDNATDTAGNGTVALARDTIRIALDAPPGQQIDLARLAVADLRGYAGERPKIAAAVRRVTVLTQH
jgi:hypothetical protein